MMKRVWILTLSMIMAISLCACGKSSTAGGENADIADSVTLLSSVWSEFAEDEKFPVGGGDFASDETTAMDEPGKFGTSDAGLLDSMLAFPENDAAKIDDAASIMHMMNANTFTCSAVRVKSGEDASKIAADIKGNLDNRQWICGMPDQYVIYTLGNYVVTAFGEKSIIDTFKTKMTAAYEKANLVYDEAVSASF